MPSALLKIARNSSPNRSKIISSAPTENRKAARRLTLTLQHRDEAYRVDIHVPAGVVADDGWPAMLMLDSEGCFETAVEALQRMSRRPDATGAAPMVLIGLSVAIRDPQARQRERDFGARGAASDFADFIETQLLPAVAAHVPIDRSALTLFGHSLGGYFTLWMLAHRPHLFAAAAAISPSIWWDAEALHAALADATLAGRRVLLCVGEWEDRLPPWQEARADSGSVRQRRADRQMVRRAHEIADLLTARLGAANVQYRLLAEEDHASIVSAAIPRALRLASSTKP
ncbi:MAG: esterase [Sphingopyxis macrogoltabida]|uniref:Esterase n=1 Tax=Sphingopyxis macrogoltabida TaxID=33050 RepID=A0A2W5KXA7_SPHMC|nr:MAG: esterase [Sphingopyxis macrogoltabida]